MTGKQFIILNIKKEELSIYPVFAGGILPQGNYK